MPDEAVDDSLAILKLILDWFVTSKTVEKMYTALHADDGLFFYVEDSGDVIFFCNEMGILSVNLIIINLDDKFDEDDPDTISAIRHLAWFSKSEKPKALGKRKVKSKYQ